MSPSVAALTIDPAGGSLTIRWDDGICGEFASLWLRDNLPEDRDRHSGQRLIDVTSLPPAPRIGTARVVGVTQGVAATPIIGATLRVAWVDGPDCTFDLEWLRTQAQALSRADPGRPELERRAWLEGAALHPQRDFAWQSLAALRADASTRLAWLTRTLQDGIGFMVDVAAEETAILDAARLAGQVLETNYGLVFDVRAVPQPENLAYSDRGLGLHTDNPYRDPVPGFQVLHVLVAAPDGGDSLFADGVALALHLRERAPRDFELLARTPVPFRYRSDAADLFAERPLIELDSRGAVTAVHYNSRAIAPLTLPVSECAQFYAAYRRFAAMLQEPRFQMRTRMAALQLVVFDNRRILHGRTGFESNLHPRHLRGCYLTRDSVYSTTALLRRQAEPEGRRT